MFKLLNSTTYEGKQYTIDDVKGFIPNETKGLPEGFYGGRVTQLAKTDVNGLYLCMENMKVIDMIIVEDELDKVVDAEITLPYDEIIEEAIYEEMTNKELTTILEGRGIEVPKRATKNDLIDLLKVVE